MKNIVLCHLQRSVVLITTLTNLFFLFFIIHFFITFYSIYTFFEAYFFQNRQGFKLYKKQKDWNTK